MCHWVDDVPMENVFVDRLNIEIYGENVRLSTPHLGKHYIFDNLFASTIRLDYRVY